MKSFIYSLLLVTALASYDAMGSKSSEENDEKKGKKISSRDLSITKENSYSDLFTDSMLLEKFIVQDAVPDSLARRLRSFYNARNYQFAWFTTNGLTEQARGFWNLHDYHTTYNHDSVLHDKKLQKKMDALTAAENLSVRASDSSIVRTEFTLTEHFIQYMLQAYDDGYVKRKEMERFVPFKKVDAMQQADSLLNKKHKDDKYFEDVNNAYRGLKEQLGVTAVRRPVVRISYDEMAARPVPARRNRAAPERAGILDRLRCHIHTARGGGVVCTCREDDGDGGCRDSAKLHALSFGSRRGNGWKSLGIQLI